MADDQSSLPVQPRNTGSQHIKIGRDLASAQLAEYDSFKIGKKLEHILVLKLDHLGDFLIGLPALRQLRALFPDARITLICGPWNAATARNLGVADDVRPFGYFPENAQNWDGLIAGEVIERFRDVCKGTFDLAVDLRVDEDTRPLLRHVDAALRCGIGSRRRHPYLNIVLPGEFEGREVRPIGTDAMTLGPRAFQSRMPVETPYYYETDFSFTENHLIWGPYCLLPLGELRAELAFQLLAPVFSLPKVNVRVEVARDDAPDVVAANRLRGLRRSVTSLLAVSFVNDNPQARYEFRVSAGGQPRGSRLRFLGMRIEVLEAPPQGARFLPAELHIGESLSLLVRLIAERVQPLYPAAIRARMTEGDALDWVRQTGACGTTKRIVVAPLSNSTLRNWPFDRYARLASLLLSGIDCVIALVGSADQAAQLDQLREQLGDDRRLVNLAGRVDWVGLARVIGGADLVIANNSGVAHLAASFGTPTLAIYSGSHQPQEWGPRGTSVRTLMAAVACSPCGHDKLESCPRDHLCMRLIEPETVFDCALEMCGGSAPAQAATDTSIAGP